MDNEWTTESRKMEVGGILWAVHLEGEGPALLLLHGFTGSHRSFDDIAPHLMSHHTVVRVDLPGHGGTRTIDNHDCSMREAVDSLHRLMGELGFTEYGVLGYSFGGRVAIALASEHKESVRLLVLESTSPGIRDDVEREKRRLADRNLARRVESVPLDEFISEWSNIPLFHSQKRLHAEQRESQDVIRRSQSSRGLASSLRGMGTGEQQSYWGDLVRLEIPVCMIVGQEDEKFLAIAREMAGSLPSSELHAIPNAGHTVHLEQPLQYRQTVVGFLQKVKGEMQ